MQKQDFTIGYVFGVMESIKDEYEIREYTLMQANLEQIFNMLAKDPEFGVK